ncbi:MAG: hypothetical protein ACRCYP_03720 [Alphaproteobacteria bacterium]
MSRVMVMAIAEKGIGDRVEINGLDMEDDGAIDAKLQSYIGRKYPGYMLAGWEVCDE